MVTSLSFLSSLLLCAFFREIKPGHICLAVLLIKPQLERGLSFGRAANLLSVLSLTVSSCLREKCISDLHVKRQ